MARRTYIPTLVALLHRACVYVARYQAILNTFLTPTQQGYLAAVVTACNTFTNSVTIEHGD